MRTIFRILERAGGYRPSLYLKIENPSYMALVIEAVPTATLCGAWKMGSAFFGVPARLARPYATLLHSA
jgi:hypothetical protein